MSAQLPPAAELVIRSGLGAGVAAVLELLPEDVRGLIDADNLTVALYRWTSSLVADVLTPPVVVTADDDAAVSITTVRR